MSLTSQTEFKLIPTNERKHGGNNTSHLTLEDWAFLQVMCYTVLISSTYANCQKSIFRRVFRRLFSIHFQCFSRNYFLQPYNRHFPLRRVDCDDEDFDLFQEYDQSLRKNGLIIGGCLMTNFKPNSMLDVGCMGTHLVIQNRFTDTRASRILNDSNVKFKFLETPLQTEVSEPMRLSKMSSTSLTESKHIYQFTDTHVNYTLNIPCYTKLHRSFFTTDELFRNLEALEAIKSAMEDVLAITTDCNDPFSREVQKTCKHNLKKVNENIDRAKCLILDSNCDGSDLLYEANMISQRAFHLMHYVSDQKDKLLKPPFIYSEKAKRDPLEKRLYEDDETPHNSGESKHILKEHLELDFSKFENLPELISPEEDSDRDLDGNLDCLPWSFKNRNPFLDQPLDNSKVPCDKDILRFEKMYTRFRKALEVVIDHAKSYMALTFVLNAHARLRSRTGITYSFTK